MPTLQDVAKRAGVSTATVSKVLSNTPYFTEETRQKVLKVVEEIGYVPNLAAKALSTGKTSIIAMVFPYIFDGIFDDPHTLLILKGMESVVSRNGYNMLLSTPRIKNNDYDQHYLQLLQSGYLDGVVAIDNIPDHSVIKAALDLKIPSVTLGHQKAPHYVQPDDRLGGKLMTQHLLDLGHRQIGVIAVVDHINLGVNQRVIGIREMVQEYGLGADTLSFAIGDFSPPSGAKALRELMDANPNISAVICLNDLMAQGVYEQALTMGYRIPEDLSIVGYDDLPHSRHMSPALTTVDQQGVKIGIKAMSMLIDLIKGKTPSSLVLPPQLIVRASTAIPR